MTGCFSPSPDRSDLDFALIRELTELWMLDLRDVTIDLTIEVAGETEPAGIDLKMNKAVILEQFSKLQFYCSYWYRGRQCHQPLL